MLDERKLKVLYAVINSYLITAEPIGSRTISKEYNLGVSPATIRNEMSDLEDKGLLMKPHSSAGRVPSDKAYRLYVNEILKSKELKRREEERDYILEELTRDVVELSDLIKNAASLLSKLTSYTALAMSPQLNRSVLKHIQLIKIGNREILLVMVNNSGVIKNSMFRINKEVEEDELIYLSNFLNDKFKGLTLDEIIEKTQLENLDEHPTLNSVLNIIIPELNKVLGNEEDVDLYYDGITKILNFPEYKDLEKAKSFMNFIENDDLLLELMVLGKGTEDIQILIGKENSIEEMEDSSIITANYKLGNTTIGRIGIIGPKRMDYFNLINTLESFSRDMTCAIDNLLR